MTDGTEHLKLALAGLLTRLGGAVVLSDRELELARRTVVHMSFNWTEYGRELELRTGIRDWEETNNTS